MTGRSETEDRQAWSAVRGHAHRIALTACVAATLTVLSGVTVLAEDVAQVVILSANIGRSEDHFVEAEAKYVAGDSDRAVVLVHQSGADMHSWGVLADVLRQNHIASIATNESRLGDVLASVHFLKEQGYSEIILLGASIGGSAVLQVLAQRDAPEISKVILLGSASGPDITDTAMPKLHIISSEDFYASSAYSAYQRSAEPKTLLELATHHHAQALFDTEFKDQVAGAIVEFVTGSE